MKTIGFYSYKGGTGKSLMAANLAVCLSRLGKHCVVVDCDIQGPSIHHKFGEGGVFAPGCGGLLKLISTSFENAPEFKAYREGARDQQSSRKDAWHALRLESVKPVYSGSIGDCLYKIASPRDETEEAPAKSFGEIRLIPAGDTSKPDYWGIAWSPLWRELFTLFNSFATQNLDQETYLRHLQFLCDIKTAISNLDPKPDYLIVDFPAGGSEMTTTLVNAWVDTIVYSLAFNRENISYLRKSFGKLRRAGKERKAFGLSSQEMALHVVLSRIPTSFDYRDRELDQALDESHYPASDLHVLHSDRDLEMVEQIRLGYQTLPQNRRLTHDYLRLFEKLIEPADVPEGGLTATLDLPTFFEEKERIFKHETQRGTLINPNDDSRNVSLKVATFQNLLLGFKEGMDGLLSDEQPHCCDTTVGSTSRERLIEAADSDAPKVRQVLRLAGHGCGAAFGDALLTKIGRDKVGMHGRIEMWTRFDSDVGFGRFVFDDSNYEEAGRGGNRRHIKCDIYLLESFLTPAIDTGLELPPKHLLCELMTGYIEGVLSRLLGQDVEVVHKHCPESHLPQRVRDEIGDVSRSPKSQSCHFAVQSKEDASQKSAQRELSQQDGKAVGMCDMDKTSAPVVTTKNRASSQVLENSHLTVSDT